MSLGCLMIDVAGTALTAEERERLRHPLVAGVILFSRNFESPDQLRALTQAIGELRTPRLLIAADQEGGRVQRFRDAFTELPPVGRLGKIYDAARPGHALRLATLTGWLMARELRAVGVDLGLAPVLDLDRHTSEVIGDRAFHGDPEVVTELTRAYIAGMAQAGMAATVKHFPGHGSVAADSHHSLPRDPRILADLQMLDLVPFERLIHAGVPSVMTAHVLYPQVDDQPASFSRRWLTEILRVELNFQGAILSDDLNMAGAAVGGALSARAARALEAGCDLLLVCNNVDGVDQILDGLDHRPDPGSLVRLARLHGRPGTDTGMPEPAEAAHAVRAYA